MIRHRSLCPTTTKMSSINREFKIIMSNKNSPSSFKPSTLFDQMLKANEGLMMIAIEEF